MALPILTIIKAVAPYVTQIATAAIPAFTSKSGESAKADPVIAKQIEELQLAATQNAQSVHVLAEQLQQTIQGIEATALDAKKQVGTYKLMLGVAIGFSSLSMMLSLYLLLR